MYSVYDFIVNKFVNWVTPVTAVGLNVVVSQGSVSGPLLFVVYCGFVGDIIVKHSVQYHQCADDMQLHLACRVVNGTFASYLTWWTNRKSYMVLSNCATFNDL